MNKYEIYLKSGQSFEVSYDGDLIAYIWESEAEVKNESCGFTILKTLRVGGDMLVIDQIAGIKHLSAT